MQNLVPVREEDRFDVAALQRELEQHIEDLRGTPEVLQFTGGASNLTYLLTYPDRKLVMRHPPGGDKPRTGHSMWREYRIIRALSGHYPVPEALYYASSTDSVIGSEFYVMKFVPGITFGSRLPPGIDWDAARCRLFCEDFWRNLVSLHELDFHRLGLEDFGHPEGYIERQVKGWNERYQAALTDDAEDFADVRRWLEKHRPRTETAHCIVHGDYRIDNLIVDPGEPHAIRAVLDWEIAALGDPLMDLGAALVYWVEPDDPEALRLLKKQPSDAPGMLSRRDIIALYAEQSGYKVKDFTFYYVYGIFRLAVIAQQIYYRYFHGQTTNPAFAGYGRGALELGRYARQVIERGLKP